MDTIKITQRPKDEAESEIVFEYPLELPQPAADFPVAIRLVDVLGALHCVDDAAKNDPESLEIDRLQNPSVEAELEQLFLLVFE